MDNVVIAHEFFHYLSTKRAGKVMHMALKLDMSKAYDRVDWVFLAKIMQKMGCYPMWI